MADDPPYLTVGTEVSAKYKGAFCEAKIRKVVRIVKCKVTFKGVGSGSFLLSDDQIKGTLRVGANVEAKHPDKNQFLEATINKIQDSSQYTVVFDDGDITTLRRTALCLKSGRHFNESETLDQLPLTHPEHFSNPVVGGRRGVRRRAADKDESSDEEEEDTPTKRDGRKRYEKELDMGKVVCVESTDKKKSKDTWFPALVVSPAAQDTVKIRIKDEYLVRSFRDGRYYTVPKKEITEFTKDSISKYDSNSNALRTAVEKAQSFLDKNELPPHWDREVLFGNARQSESGEGEDPQSDDDASEDDPKNEEKDRFIAQLYKFMDDRGTPLNKVPIICNKELDLYKVYQVVTSKGGYTKVTNQGQWKSVVVKMNFGNMPSTSTINLVKQAYKKSLVHFEDFYRKLGCVWTPRSSATQSKSRSSRSIFRDRATPSSSRESSKKGDDEDGRSTPSKRERDKEKKEKEKESKEKEEKVPPPTVEVDSPKAEDTGSECSTEVKKAPPAEVTVEEPRKSSRGRQPKKIPEDEETASPSSRKKRKVNTSASRDRDRDSSVASSTKEEKESSAPPTPSSNAPAPSTPAATPTTPTGKKGVGRGKYKRPSKPPEKEEEKPEPKVKEEEKVEEPEKPVIERKSPGIEIRLGDKLKVFYPKSEGETYEAKVIDINEKNESFLVHYLGWNNRYDEWIDRARVSQNLTLSLEQSGEVDKSAVTPGATTTNAQKGKEMPIVKQRKGRNSSSATSSTSASSVTTTTSTTPAGTRSGSVAKGGIPPSSSPVSSKRRRSTSTEVVQQVAPPKRRRTRQKSGQDGDKPQSGGPFGSDSEPETSDSDGKSIKSELSPSKPAPKEKGSSSIPPDAREPAADVVVEKEVKTRKRVTEESKSSKSEKKATAPTPEDIEEKAAKEIPKPVEDSKDSTTSSTGSSTGSSSGAAQVIDLDQIRSEMKGLDKMVKGSGTGSVASPGVSSPAPPLLAAVGGSPQPTASESAKLDVYEFQEDGSDDQAMPITTTAPKLKMFSPVARGSVTVPDKSPVVSASSAEAVAKLMSTDQEKDKPVPIVAMEKMEKDKLSKSEKEKEAATVPPVKERKEPKEPKPQTIPPPKSVLPPVILPVTQTVAGPYPPAQASVVGASPLVAPTPPVTTAAAQAAPPPPVLTSVVSIATTTQPQGVTTSTSSTTAPSATQSHLAQTPVIPVTAGTVTAPGPTPVIISSATLLKVKAAAESAAGAAAATAAAAARPPVLPSTPTPIVIQTKSPVISGPVPILLPGSMTTQGGSPASMTVTMTTASVPILNSPQIVTTPSPSLVTISNLSSVSSPPPPMLFQQQRPVISIGPTTTPSSAPTVTPERPVLSPVVAATVAATVIKSTETTPKSVLQAPSSGTVGFTARKQELFPHLVQQTTGPTTPTSVESIAPPVINIVTKLDVKDHDKLQGATLIGPSPILNQAPAQPSVLSSTALPKPLKVAATIPPPPPPPVVIKTTTLAPAPVLKPVFGPGPTTPIPVVPPPSEPPKQKKKKAKASLGLTTPVKQLAPLPAVGAPPPPPVVVSTPASIAPPTVTVTPTPGRKTPVKKRIPPPMDSPGKPKSTERLGKPGKMNPEAMNAAIASVGAAPPAPPPPPPPPIIPPQPVQLSVPTTVITSTSASLFQQGPPPAPLGVHFTTGSGAVTATPVPPPPVSIAKTSGIGTIKSSAESIAASIAAVASMGATLSPSKPVAGPPPPVSSKSGPPMKRFMKDNSDKFVPQKEKVFTISPVTTPSMSQGPVVISRPSESPFQQQQQQQQHTQQPPITIQPKFQSSHTLQGPSGPAQMAPGPAVTFVKASPSPGPGPHHLMDPHQVHAHPPSNLSKHPVIIIPAAPVVIKPAPFQHGPVIVSKPMHVDGPRPHTPSPSPQEVAQPPPPPTQPPTVLVSTASSHSLKPMLPITVTPSSVQVSSVQVPVSFSATTMQSMSTHGLSSTTPAISISQSLPTPPAVEFKPMPMQELPPTITVTKTTTVMKSISPDIVAVSSYNSSRNTSSSGYTPLKQAARSGGATATNDSQSHSKEPDIVVKPAPASAQIVFHTATDSKKVEVIRQTPAVTATPTFTPVPKVEVKEPDENSLLCEEIIPGSPTTGEDLDDKPEESSKEEEEEEGKADKKVVEEEEEDDEANIKPEVPVEPPVQSPSPPVPQISHVFGGPGPHVPKPVILVGPKMDEDELDEPEGFVLDERRSFKFGDDDDDDNKLEERSVDSPMGPPSEGREADLPFRDSFSDGGDHSPPSSPSSGSTISTDDSSRQHDTSRLSPTPEGGSSKSKESDDDDMDSDVGSKSTHLDDDSKHGSTRGSTRIRNQSSRLGRSPSPPMSKRRRIMRRNRSPEEILRYTQRTIRTSSGRKVTPTGRGADMMRERELEREVKQPPPPPINLAKPPKTGKYNFIPNLNGVIDPDQRIALITQSINDLKEQYQKTKSEAASFERRVKRWKRRVREKERLARQEATRSTS